ncbi:hypothetical protein CHU92_05900 [Flavobacterium cyanobacteriorum]|uniref:Competence protein ComEA n=1 Tax=Flavobacterium cyanobacteriorum TaxID=2022802 RepID=A0A255Z9Y3_9FLAO|nr:helix-hairpin-helix domain-containing protein [Flavobacterium cyanobacteriorum]OYQ38242.1 hypothetical protein CHU92_05900 [Flavobacterium cyanobacteriorum]
MKKPWFFTSYSRQQRNGIMALFLLIIVIQATYFIYTSIDNPTIKAATPEEKEWLSLQSGINELKAAKVRKVTKIYPFNPNFISDYKGYTLGMSVTEIDRLHKFREKGLWINSAEDFKRVTGVHDTLLAKLRPYFKFPDWVLKRRSKDNLYTQTPNSGKPYFDKDKKNLPKAKEQKIPLLDINQAVEADLEKVYGIGPSFAKKIIRRRAQLGAFVSMDQMEEFDFPAETVSGLKRAFYIGSAPPAIKINVNDASLNQLSYFPYFNKNLARSIITRRSMKGKINKFEELLEINDFPVDKQNIIALYLEF